MPPAHLADLHSASYDDPLIVIKAYHRPKTEYRIFSERYDLLFSRWKKNKAALRRFFVTGVVILQKVRAGLCIENPGSIVAPGVVMAKKPE